MSLPEKITIETYRGDSKGLVVACWKDAEKTDPADLSGTEIRAQIRPEPDSSSVTGEFEVNVAGNLITLNLLPKVSAELDPANVFDVQVIFDPPTGLNVQTVLRGAIACAPDVTRA